MLGHLSSAKFPDLKGHLNLSAFDCAGVEMSFQLMFYVHNPVSQDSMSFQDIPSWAIMNPSLRDSRRDPTL